MTSSPTSARLPNLLPSEKAIAGEAKKIHFITFCYAEKIIFTCSNITKGKR